ncbi:MULTISPECIES: hypothetical protein [unclassified Streptomyces]|uniref:DNA polymerase Y family protein n=1 Tax=unclassified Streptomyces TaxID=2593676 RepID=UPI002E1436E3|nr:hypothetical protein OG533_06525 [Streptomyces sp. NBC_01186]WSS40320.1 hypothetical protein OG220_06670 [Streptomyces sp. NBC_01187]
MNGRTGRTGPDGAAPEHEPHVLYVHFGARVREHPERYEALLALLTDITPVVQPLPPEAALADVRGALRYFGRDAVGLAQLVRLRALALHGTDCAVGVAASPLLARMAATAGPPESGRVREVRPEEAAGFLDRRPVAALHGVGPATARTLCSYGLDSVGRVAAAPPATLQRILGAVPGRRVHEWARGIDPTPVTPTAPARSAGAEHRFGHDELDAGQRRRALLTLADELGFRMRTERQVARGLSLTVRYADRSATTRTRRLAEPTAHTPTLAATAYALHDALGLQRARVRGLALRVEELTAAELATHQLSFEARDEKARRAEAAADRARHRFGADAARPAGGWGRAAA